MTYRKSEVMKKKIVTVSVWGSLTAVLVAVLVACGGGGAANFGSSTQTPTPTPVPTPGGGTGGPGGGGWAQNLVPGDSADLDCMPALPDEGQKIKVTAFGEDGQGLFPQGSSDVTYTIGADNSFTITSANEPAYLPSPNSGGFDSSGYIVSPNFPVMTDPLTESVLTFSPSDWMQQVVGQDQLNAEGGVFETTIGLSAKGLLPGLLTDVLIGGATEPFENAIEATLAVKVTRLPNAVVGGVPLCKYKFTLLRPDIRLDEAAALASYQLTGTDFVESNLDLETKLSIEMDIPMMEGEFATSNQVPFVPVYAEFTHIYGISSAVPKDAGWQSSTGKPINKDLPPTPPYAKQRFAFVSVE